MSWKLITTLCFLLLFLISGKSNGQSLEQLEQEWESFRRADDNEKDYRFNSFLMLLEEYFQNGYSIDSDSSFLEGWHSEVSEDNKYMVFATLVDFEIRPDRLLYCILDNTKEDVIALYKEVGNGSKEGNIGIDMKNLSHGISLNVRKEKQNLLAIPDLEILFLLQELMQSRGQDVVFSLSESLMSRMEVLLGDLSLFNHDFADYPGLSTLISDDEKLKTITWNVEEFTGDHHFFGLVGVRNDDAVRVFQLEDRRVDIPSPEFAGVGPEKWYGAVYYQMVEEKFKGDSYYTVLGFNGNNAFSRIRVVDVIFLDQNGSPRFGAPIFEVDGRTKRRLIFEFSNKANMMLRYDQREKLIVMDHLAPLDPGYEGDRSYYGPDFSYDVLEFNKGKWVLEKDVDLRNR